VPEVSSRCKQVYHGSSVWKQVGISIYLRESLKGPKWLIPEVPQPQVPPSKKSETYYVRFCVCPHKENQKTRWGKKSGVVGIAGE
jgi:hypothetical protein